MSAPIRSIVIVGGGTAGWIAAAILARALPNVGLEITVIESQDIGTVGVGEATIPPILDLLRFLSIDEANFVAQTQATYKLGIRFADWSRIGEDYWHPFGTFGVSINRRPFYQAFLKARANGLRPRFNDFSLGAVLGESNLFRFPDAAGQGPENGLRYALHFDAALVARYLRAYAERLGVTRLEKNVVAPQWREDGFLTGLMFSDGGSISGDLFLDCSGFRGVLIEQVLGTGYEDWTHWLPCNRAVAMPTELKGPRPPYTYAQALTGGWRWRIPLQHRVGNGYVYSSAHTSDHQALDELIAQTGEPSGDPRVLRFVTGRRKSFWNRNVVALGLASGFLEPLESTSIHLVISGVYNLLDHFPDKAFEPANISTYNAELAAEMNHIRDFLILHYCTTRRDDTDFWRRCAALELPESLQDRIALYRGSGRVANRPGELFTDLSWFYVYEGMGVIPDRYDPLMDVVQLGQFREILGKLATSTAAAARGAHRHDDLFPQATGIA